MLLFLHLLALFFLLASAALKGVFEERDTFSPHIQCAIQKLRSILACISKQPLAFGLKSRNWKDSKEFDMFEFPSLGFTRSKRKK